MGVPVLVVSVKLEPAVERGYTSLLNVTEIGVDAADLVLRGGGVRAGDSKRRVVVHWCWCHRSRADYRTRFVTGVNSKCLMSVLVDQRDTAPVGPQGHCSIRCSDGECGITSARASTSLITLASRVATRYMNYTVTTYRVTTAQRDNIRAD